MRAIPKTEPSSSQGLGTVAVVIDATMIPQGGRVVLVMLKDGRQIEGELIVMTNCYYIAGTVFQDWQIETLEGVT